MISFILQSFQIEDAMLMFDKQTNRHRGKSFDSLTLENLYHER